MTHELLLTAIFTKIGSISGLPTVLYPNRKYPNSTLTALPNEYVRIHIMPIPTDTFSFDGGILQAGLIQCDCVIKEDLGEIKAAQIADKIINALPNTTVISAELKVSKPPYASGGLQLDNGAYMIPVTIQYKAISK